MESGVVLTVVDGCPVQRALSSRTFNRRHSRARGLLFYRLMQLAVSAPPLTYRHLVVNPQPKRRRPTAPQGRRSQPETWRFHQRAVRGGR